MAISPHDQNYGDQDHKNEGAQGPTFICYAHEDKEFARVLAQRLRAAGAHIWFDEWDIPGGADWDKAIDQALIICEQLLIVLSPAATNSFEVRGELHISIEQGKRVIPVLIESCPIPRQLRVVQYINLIDRDINNNDTLKDILRALDPGLRLNQSPNNT